MRKLPLGVTILHNLKQNRLLIIHITYNQWRSQDAEKVTHIKGRLLDQAAILFNCVPFQGKFAPRESKFFPLRAVPDGMEKSLLPYIR